MKIKPTRICARKGCNNEFKLHRSTDKHCSPSCFYADQKAKPKKIQKPIKSNSDKRKAESYLYTKKRNIFMSKPENKYCPVCKAAYEGKIDINQIDNNWLIKANKGLILTTECHHIAGKKGKLLTYVPLFLAVSTIGHRWIHANPKESYKLGFQIKATTVNI